MRRSPVRDPSLAEMDRQLPAIAVGGVGRELPDWVDRWGLVAVLWIVFALVVLWWLRMRLGPGGAASPARREQRTRGHMRHPYDVSPGRYALALIVAGLAALVGLTLSAVGVTGAGVDEALADVGPIVLAVVLVVLAAVVLARFRAAR